MFKQFSFIVAFLLLLISSCKNETAKPDLCKDVSCQHGGSCDNGFCNCTPGWIGAKCETYYTTLFEGKFTGQGFSCGQLPAPFNDLDVIADTNNPGKIYLRNNLYATMDGAGSNYFTITPQTVVALSIWGDGYFIDNDNVYLNLKIGMPGVGQMAECTGNFKKIK